MQYPYGPSVTPRRGTAKAQRDCSDRCPVVHDGKRLAPCKRFDEHYGTMMDRVLRTAAAAAVAVARAHSRSRWCCGRRRRPRRCALCGWQLKD